MNLQRRHFLKVGATSAALLAVGCNKLPRELRDIPYLSAKKDLPFQPSIRTEIDPIVHLLNRASFGPRPGDFESIQKLDRDPKAAALAHFETQLHPDKIDDEDAEYIVRRFETLNEPLGELYEYQETLLQNELMRATLARAVSSERQLYEVMVQFWSDHFNIDPSKGDCKWLKVADDREVIRKHALGHFPEMLRASALSPAMLWYLDGRVNRREKMSEKPNENYGRELLELHTLGVHGGYTQKDVMEVARCLTGWTVRSKAQKPYFQIGKVDFNPKLHDFGSKEILGKIIPATPANISTEERERRGRLELDRVLAIVTKHPATAQHLATKLCRHFISDTPPQSAVDKVAAAFTESEGNIKVTLKALFHSDEFWASSATKFKRPFNFIVSALRSTQARTDSSLAIIEFLQRMGHAPFNFPTPDGYPEQAAPWMGTLLWRWNFAVALSENKIKGTTISLDKLLKNAGNDESFMAHMLGRKATPEEAHAYRESEAGLALLLACPAFQMC